MKTLIVEDDFTSRVLLQEFLLPFGPVHVAVNGVEAVAAVATGLAGGEPYDLVCLDIMMPRMDGQEALRRIRELEDQAGLQGLDRVKIIMVTALSDKDNVRAAFREQCDGYLRKPLDRLQLLQELRRHELI